MERDAKLTFRDFRDRMDEVCRTNAASYMVTCLMDTGHVVSLRFSRLTTLIERFAATKEEYGLRDGDRVFVLTPYIADAFITFEILACNHLTVVLGDPSLPPEELSQLIAASDVSAILTDQQRFPLVESFDSVPIFQCYGLRYDLKLLQAAKGERPDTEPTPGSVAIIFSSGTTARMKPIEIPYESMILCANRNFDSMDVGKRDEAKPYMMVFPVHHISGLACATGMCLKGLTVATVETATSASLVGALRAFEPFEFGMVPKVLSIFISRMEEELKRKHVFGVYSTARRIANYTRTKFNNRMVGEVVSMPFRRALFGKNMHTILSGGGPCPPELAQAILDLGLNLVINYSSTECGVPILESDAHINDCLDCVGEVGYDPNVQIKINDPDEDGIGEIYVKSRYMMSGYYREPELTEAAFDDGWFKTGDNGSIDERGYLHVSGRSKDSIMLASGKKVAPDDLESMLAKVIGTDASFSVVGVPDEEAGVDTIHVFLAGELDETESKSLIDRIRQWQRTAARIYPISGIHFLKDLPKTSVGKVKRNILRDLLSSTKGDKQATDEGLGEESAVPEKKDTLQRVLEIVKRISGSEEELTGKENLVDDLGINSLHMMQLVGEIEIGFGVFIGSRLQELTCAEDIAAFIDSPRKPEPEMPEKKESGTFDVSKFPKRRKAIHRAAFEVVGSWFERHVDFKVEGLEGLTRGESYIFCPNHQTHADGLWVWRALGDLRPPLDYIGCLAKKEHLDNVLGRFMLSVLGGIPVDREGNTTDSIRRSVEFIREGNSFLIHPEGTRTRDGELGEFKDGAALMAHESGVRVVPVAIDGGLEGWSFDKLLPKTRDPKTKKPRKVRISFLEPIAPDAGTEEEVTERIRQAIAQVLQGPAFA